jgi:RNA polymerase sigma-70 factor, ECF subfamily
LAAVSPGRDEGLKVAAAAGHSASPTAATVNAPSHSTAALLPADLDLVERCRQGEEAAWRALYEDHFDFVWRTARRLGTPAGELDDVVQESFLVAWDKLAAFQHGRLDTWLFRITANVVSGRHRRRRVRETFLSWFEQAPAAPGPQAPDAALETKDAQLAVAAVLARMAPKKREVFALFELEGLSGEEVAQRVGCGVDTVWTRLFHARKDFERLGRKLGAAP